MKIIASDIVIIGGGLTGLTLAHLFRSTPYKVHIIEARERLGGRIYTNFKNELAPIEMGATWLSKQHTALHALLKTLKLDVFEQELGEKAIYEPSSLTPHQLVTLPPNSDASYRIKDGTSKLIDTLAASIAKEHVFYNELVSSIKKEEDFITIQTKKNIFKADNVVSTLPPYLLQSTIKITPDFPLDVIDIMENTHTWMGESIKVGLRFKTPFWRTDNSSGTIFSNVGPIPEFYDHSNYEGNQYALKGFFNSSYFSLSKDERLKMVLLQLRNYYGDVVDTYLSYEEKVWRNEPFTYSEYHNHILPHQNNGHNVFQKPYLDGAFFIAGAETATQFPGYMEGAIRSAYFVFDKINL